MMLAKSLQSAAGNAAGEANYIESVFQTHLYTGNGSTQTITNGIDLAGEGGLVWIKNRGAGTTDHRLFDTTRGIYKSLSSNLTDAEDTSTSSLTAFNADGFSLSGFNAEINDTSNTYASWTFRKAPKFFDVVTYTGDATAGRTIAHNLGSVPGCIIVKRLNGADNWTVYHRGIDSVSPQNYIIYLNTTDARSDQDLWADTAPTDSVFSVGDNIKVNGSSSNTYVAYLFAHNAGGFGLSGEDNVISCGSFTTDGSGNATVDLGYEPQWVMFKLTDRTSNWEMRDTMRGFNVSGDNRGLLANTSGAEFGTSIPTLTNTGFNISWGAGFQGIYIAIRRGPMKTPTSGTSVFNTDVGRTAASGATPAFISNFVTDLGFVADRTTAGNKEVAGRLTGATRLRTNTTDAEAAQAAYTFDYMTGWNSAGSAASSQVSWMFRRAPGFFDEVCYSGTGSARTVAHNLGVVPELMIVKSRSVAGSNWLVYNSTIGPTNSLYLNLTTASDPNSFVNNTAPTSSVFSLGTSSYANGSGSTYVAYLFATLAGVSKVGSYTGTGTTQQINCGFTGGARFVLIKRTDSTGDWYVWDSARGIVAGNDSYLLLNSTAAEVTSTDYIDTYSAGFEISSTAPAAINASGGTFLFFAVA